MPELYGDLLARIHAEGFASVALGAAPGIARLLRQHGVRRGLVLDLACGPGHLSRELARRGYETHGVDVSRAMLRLARRRAPRLAFAAGSLTTARLPRADAAVVVGEGLNYLRGPAELARALHNIARALRRGGVLLFDLRLAASGGTSPVTTRVRLGGDWAVVATSTIRGKRLTRDITSLAGPRRTHEVHRQHLYSEREVLRALERAGFRGRALPDYHGFRPGPHHGVFLGVRVFDTQDSRAGRTQSLRA
jgi:SAM-dependent methyltransferase